jgi:hypothetical protein
VPYKEAAYDPVAADRFFRARPIAALRRLYTLFSLSAGFVVATVLDGRLGREEEMTERRSEQLLELVTSLGPAFVKIGQALSIRTDLVPAAYVAGLTRLQDSVPPFSPAQGRAVIEDELGIALDDVFSYISLEPVASASIGQVYKGTLASTGDEVAVKVQRPGVLYNIALDLFMLRSIAPFYQRATDGARRCCRLGCRLGCLPRACTRLAHVRRCLPRGAVDRPGPYTHTPHAAHMHARTHHSAHLVPCHLWQPTRTSSRSSTRGGPASSMSSTVRT